MNYNVLLNLRSTFIHITNVSRSDIVTVIDEHTHEGLYIDFYEDHESEYEEEERLALIDAIGVFPPDHTVVADISGNIVGYDESISLAKVLLSKFSGVVQDDYDGIWTLEELLKDGLSDGRYFMESSRRQAGMELPLENKIE